MPRAVAWIGRSEVWDPPQPQGGEHFTFPTIEEHVLEVAHRRDWIHSNRLMREPALNCSSRSRMRRALQSGAPHLNPRWLEIDWIPGVVKAPASTLNLGVRTLPSNEYVERLRGYSPEDAGRGVIEEFVEGPQFEVDGVVIHGDVHVLAFLAQEWSDDGSRITRYQRIQPGDPDASLKEAAIRAVHAVGLTNAPFCVELRQSRAGWKVIEIHARIGEDERLPAILGDPFEQIERIAQRYV